MRQRLWQRALRAAGLPALTIHSLRHTFVSQLIAHQANPRSIQAQLGHTGTGIGIMMNTYGQLFPSEPRRAATTLEGSWGSPTVTPR